MKKRLPLRRFRLQNFKAVRDSGNIDFGPLTVFIGNNGSGKSSLIEGLETFRDVVLDGLDKAMDRWRGFEHVWCRAVKHNLRHGNDARPHHTHPMIFRIHLRMETVSVRAKQEVNLGEGGNELFIQREEMIRAGFDEVRRDAHGNQQMILPGQKRTISVKPKLDDGESILRDAIGPELARWQFLGLVPDVMGQPAPQQRAGGRVRLAKTGANVAEYLNEIRKLDLDAFNGILDSLRYVLPYLRDLQPALTLELQRAFYLRLKEEDFEIPGWLLSTGTLRVLALLACLRHPDPPPVLVIEELENGLDPRTLQLLVNEIRESTQLKQTQVILTTHSPSFLDLLPMSSIVMTQRSAEGVVFTRPADAKDVQVWMSDFAPGQLYLMGRLDAKENS